MRNRKNQRLSIAGEIIRVAREEIFGKRKTPKYQQKQDQEAHRRGEKKEAIPSLRCALKVLWDMDIHHARSVTQG